MDIGTITTIFNLVTQIASYVVKYGPTVITNGEAVIADLKLAFESLTSGTTITAAQQQQIDAALNNANTLLQAAVTTEQAQT